MTLIMIIMIVVGVGLAVTGLVLAVLAGLRLYRKVKEVQKAIDAQVTVIMRKQDEVMERLASIEDNQQILAERVERMKRATGKLGYVLRQWSEAQERFTKVP